jgi:hypothetical protein
MSIYAVFKLQRLIIKTRINPFARGSNFLPTHRVAPRLNFSNGERLRKVSDKFHFNFPSG